MSFHKPLKSKVDIFSRILDALGICGSVHLASTGHVIFASFVLLVIFATNSVTQYIKGFTEALDLHALPSHPDQLDDDFFEDDFLDELEGKLKNREERAKEKGK